MTNLRERVVEAGARAIANKTVEEFAALTAMEQGWYRLRAEAALDAMLDCLPHHLGDVTAEDLVAELREDR